MESGLTAVYLFLRNEAEYLDGDSAGRISAGREWEKVHL